MANEHLAQIRQSATELLNEIHLSVSEMPERRSFASYGEWQQAKRQWWADTLPLIQDARRLFPLTKLAKVVGVSRHYLRKQLERYLGSIEVE